MVLAAGKSQAILWTPGSVPNTEPVTLELQILLEPNWHSYWLDPGEAGSPPELKWKLPEGWKVREVVWPLPERFEHAGIMTVGYTKEVRASVVVEPAAGAQGRFEIGADLGLVVCEEECVYETHSLQAALDIGPGSASQPLPKPGVPRPSYRFQDHATFRFTEGEIHLDVPRLIEVTGTPPYVLCETAGLLDLRAPVSSWKTEAGIHKVVLRTTSHEVSVSDELTFIVPANDTVAYRVTARRAKTKENKE